MHTNPNALWQNSNISLSTAAATPEGREVSAAELRHWHTDPVSKGGRGWKQVGYTDMFHLDGSVERLVQNNEDANVDPWELTNGAAGFNSVSRHIVYVGGLAKTARLPKTHALPCNAPRWHATSASFTNATPRCASWGITTSIEQRLAPASM